MVNRLTAWAGGWLDAFRSPGVDLTNSLAPGVSFDSWAKVNAADVAQAMDAVAGMPAAKVYATQPNVRAVVDFLARNVAQLGLHSFVKDEDGGRERDHATPIAQLLEDPSPAQSPFELVRSIVADLVLFDEAWLWVTKTTLTTSGWLIRPLPVDTVTVTGGTEWTGDLVVDVQLGKGRAQTIKHGNLIHLHGWAPAYGVGGVSPLVALRTTLAEQVAAEAYRAATWKNGGQVGSYITRPKDAPRWSAEAEDKFVKSMRAYRGGGDRMGGQPLLQDGMEIKTVRLSAKEEQWVEAAQLSLELVCRVFQVNPTMLGSTGGVTYANLKEFRRALYTETLAPILAQVEQKLTRELQRIVGGAADPDHYLEFNLKAKLAGSFEEEGDVLQKAVGGPHMTLNEARARQNLKGIGPAGDVVLKPLNMAATGGTEDGEAAPAMSADELLKRVNVAKGLIQYGFEAMAALQAAGLDPIQHLGLLPTTLQSPVKVDAEADAAVEAVGGDAPADAPDPGAGDDAPKAAGRVHVKAAQAPKDSARSLDLVRGVLSKHAVRQRAAVLSRMGSKSAGWWDGERWDRELADELAKVAVTVTQQMGAAVAAELGFEGTYDPAVTLKFLAAVARSRAEMLNATTYAQLKEAVAKAEDGAPAHVFDELEGARGDQAAITLHSTLAAFAGVEAAKQVGRRASRKATKTWVVTSGHPRAAHARMDGQTVPVDQKFSNGAHWPGDPVLGADGVAGCLCGVEVEVLDDNE